VKILTPNRLLALAAAGVLAFAVLVVSPLGAGADATNTGNYNSRAYANGVHLVGDTSAFPNFEGPNSKGAVDNHYPLARVTQDASPSSHAVASYADVGPLGQTVVACSNPDQTQCPPTPGAPYANADFPGGSGTGHVDSCTPAAATAKQPNPCPNNQPALYADSSAGQMAAAASGFYLGGSGQPFAGALSDVKSTVGDDGSLTVHAHSAVASATFGPFQVNKVDVLIDVVSAGGQVTTQTVTITIGSVTLNGQPVKVTDQGVSTSQQIPVPCPSGLPSTSPLQVGSGVCTPQVTTDNITIATVNPRKTVDGSHATITAVGLDVFVTHPPVPGAPQQKVEYVLGEAFVDAFNDPTMADNSAGGDFGAASFGGDFGNGGDFGVSGASGAAPPNSGATHLRTMLVANRQPLALLFLFWETLVLGAAAAYVWARRKPVLPELGPDS
jgi:hypothetical protein